MRLFQQLPIPLPVALGGTGVANGNWAATTLALTSALTSVGADIGTSGVLTFGSRSKFSSSVDGNAMLTNNAGTSFGLLRLGGTTSSFAALKLNGTGLSARLADDSADTSFTAAAFILGTITSAPTNGMFLNGANQVGIATNGTNRLNINSSGVVQANGNIQTATSTGPAILASASSSTVATLIANRSDTTSGLGGAAGAPALIAGRASILTVDTNGTTIASGKKLILGNAATTGLTAGVLAATTNASIVLYDSNGQAYRIPCII